MKETKNNRPMCDVTHDLRTPLWNCHTLSDPLTPFECNVLYFHMRDKKSKCDVTWTLPLSQTVTFLDTCPRAWCTLWTAHWRLSANYFPKTLDFKNVGICYFAIHGHTWLPLKMSLQKIFGQNVVIKMSQIKMSLNNNGAGENVAFIM